MPWYRDFGFNTEMSTSSKISDFKDIMEEKAGRAFQGLAEKIEHSGDKSGPHIIRGRFIIYTKKEWDEYMAGKVDGG